MMHVVIRVDASYEIGAGHVMRCVTLANSLRENGTDVYFVSRSYLGNLNHYIAENGFMVRCLHLPEACNEEDGLNVYQRWLSVSQDYDAEETIKAIDDLNVGLLVIDHYALDKEWEVKVGEHVNKIMVIDDMLNRPHCCDFLLNQNYGYSDNDYVSMVSPDTIKLLGPKYALLRPSFVEARNKKKSRKFGSINKVFVSFGGADPDNMTGLVLDAFNNVSIKDISVDVVIGEQNQHKDTIRACINERSNAQLYVQVDNIADLMAASDLAFGAGGITTWERMSVGLPSITVTVADNQVLLSKALDKDGYIKWLGDSIKINKEDVVAALYEMIDSPQLLLEQSRKCKELVDGKGAGRIAKLLTAGPDVQSLKIRSAESADCLLYWCWANDHEVRQNAFNQKAISWEGHQQWFSENINNSDVMLLLIESGSCPIGQVRLVQNGEYYKISYSLAKQWRGMGMGKIILMMAIEHIEKSEPCVLVAEVKETNLVSKKIFERLGFDMVEFKDGIFRYRFQISSGDID